MPKLRDMLIMRMSSCADRVGVKDELGGIGRGVVDEDQLVAADAAGGAFGRAHGPQPGDQPSGMQASSLRKESTMERSGVAEATPDCASGAAVGRWRLLSVISAV